MGKTKQHLCKAILSKTYLGAISPAISFQNPLHQSMSSAPISQFSIAHSPKIVVFTSGTALSDIMFSLLTLRNTEID